MEQAYCFFHQKWRVYSGKSSETQQDDIEYAVSAYADAMDAGLFTLLSGGNPAFLHEHSSFAKDITHALALLERGLG